jgi:peptidoglycan/xylan/chitin deacetylase (PgdA/CDA1 family)
VPDTGKPPVPIRWPGDARIAMSIVVAFEAFSFVSHYRSRPGPPGEPDQASLSYAEYGPKTGVWRVLEMLDREGLKASFHVSGLAAERWPLTLKEIFRRGHEVVGHGWTNDNLSSGDYTEAREHKDIIDTIAAIEAAIGEKPVGWSSPGSKGSANKFRILIEESNVRWIGDDASDDVPFLRRIDGKTIVMMPRNNLPANDLTLWLTPANPPSVYFDSFKDAFDLLYEEGGNGSPKWMEMVIHCHIGARPGLALAIRRVIEYAKRHDKVWFARRRDIADHMLSTYA